MGDSERTAEAGPGDDHEPDGGGRDERDHLADVQAGAGCTEIWEHLSEQRAREG